MDALLLLMVFIWGSNYSLLKRAFAELPPQAFNTVRLGVASLVFLALIRWTRWRSRRAPGSLPSVFYTDHALTRRDRWDLVWLGLTGHFGYQWFFIRGVSITSVSNAAVIVGITPAVVMVLSALLGRERITRVHWLGAGLSLIGLYFVVGSGVSFQSATIAGDLLVLMSVGCWALYTLGSARLVSRHSALYVTGITMAIGAVPYILMSLPVSRAVAWTDVPGWVFAAAVLSALLAFCLSYVIWYVAVQRLGPSRTSAYSNLIPIVAMGVAVLWLHEPVSGTKVFGAAGVLAGVALTRLGRQAPAVAVEE